MKSTEASSPSVASVSLAAPPADPAWRSASRVLTDAKPEIVAALAIGFEAPGATDDVRRAVLDVLAASGSADAQATVRRLLATPVARRDAGLFADLVQRLGQIARPDEDTLLFAAGLYAEARREPESVRAACAYALGACAGNARLAGQADAATRMTDALRHDLERAPSAAMRASLVLALGNAGLVADAPLVAALETDADARVRVAAIVARRRFEDSALAAETALAAARLEMRSAMAETALAAPLRAAAPRTAAKTALALAVPPEVLAREAASVAIVASRRPLRALRPVRRPAVLP